MMGVSLHIFFVALGHLVCAVGEWLPCCEALKWPQGVGVETLKRFDDSGFTWLVQVVQWEWHTSL